MPTRPSYRIATIPGDGIGKEVIPAGQRAVEAVARRHGFSVTWYEFDWSCARYAATGRMMPQDGVAQVRCHDAIYLGAVGWPGVPDQASLWGLLEPLHLVRLPRARDRPRFRARDRHPRPRGHLREQRGAGGQAPGRRAGL